MHPVCLGLALALSVVAGVAFGYAWIGGKDACWTLGGIALLAAVVTAVGALCGPRRVALEGATAPEWSTTGAPPLGEMLVRLRMISPGDLDKALARQQGSKKRLGQILVEMKVLTHAELAGVLEEQLTRRQATSV